MFKNRIMTSNFFRAATMKIFCTWINSVLVTQKKKKEIHYDFCRQEWYFYREEQRITYFFKAPSRLVYFLSLNFSEPVFVTIMKASHCIVSKSLSCASSMPLKECIHFCLGPKRILGSWSSDKHLVFLELPSTYEESPYVLLDGCF